MVEILPMWRKTLSNQSNGNMTCIYDLKQNVQWKWLSFTPDHFAFTHFEICVFSLCCWCCCFSSHSTIFHSYGYANTNGEDLCSALMAIKHWGFCSASQVLWHGASVYNGHIRGPVTLAQVNKQTNKRTNEQKTNIEVIKWCWGHKS